MAASDTELKWNRIDQFAGLHDGGSNLLMPPNAAQLMSGCHPHKDGGLRAFYKPRPWSTTAGLIRSDPVVVTGLFATTVAPDDLYVLTGTVDDSIDADIPMRPTGADPRIYGGSVNTDTPWDQATDDFDNTTTLFGDIELPLCVTIRSVDATTGSAADYIILSSSVESLEPDIFKITFSGVISENVGNSSQWKVLGKHQQRLIAGYGPSIVFTSPGVQNFPNSPSEPTGFVNLGHSTVAGFVSQSPNDLLVVTRDGAIFNIQGDLADPTVRQIAPARQGNYSHFTGVLSTAGPVVHGPRGPFIVSSDGGVQPLAEHLSDDHWYVGIPDLIREAMHMVSHGEFLFCRNDNLLRQRIDDYRRTFNSQGTITDFEPWPPDGITEWRNENRLRNNGFLTYDFRTGAWFNSCHPDEADFEAPFTLTSIPRNYGVNLPTVVGVPSKEITGPTAEPLGYGHNTYGPRASVYEWRSAPLRSDGGKVVSLQAVQFGVHGWTKWDDDVNMGTLTVTATNELGRTDTTYVDVPVGNSIVTAHLQMEGSYVDVTVKAESLDDEIEAPMLEFVSFGWTEKEIPYRSTATGGYANAYLEGY